MAILLAKFQGLQHNSAPEVVVADLAKTHQGKLLAEGMALETVVTENAAEIRMSPKGNAKKVPDLPFQPVGSREKATGAGNSSIRSSTKGQPKIKTVGKELINQLKPR